jgi:FtsP/CotA-like multicopper oxidase with cupredoxin domain
VYEMWLGIELLSMVLLFVIAWIAGKKASGMLYSGTLEKLYHKTGKQLFWAAYVLVLATVPFVAVYGLMQSFTRLFWEYPLLLHAPFIALPALAVLFVSVPKLLRLRKTLRGVTGPIQESQVRHMASQPGLIVPFQATALGAPTALYFSFVPPNNWMEIAVPTAVFLILTAALWIVHSRRCRIVSQKDAVIDSRPWLRALRDIGLLAVAGAAAAFLIYTALQNSYLPGKLDMMAGKMDYGGGTVLAHAHSQSHTSAASVSVTKLTGPATGIPDRRFTLTAEHGTVRLSSGKTVDDAWTYNGQIPGPELRMKQGELVEVTLLNKDIEDGVTLHWHGLDVPNAEDGVAGATQDAVMPGEKHVYRFLADQVGTFWYHSHQNSQQAVSKGLFGSLIVEPKAVLSNSSVQLTKDITVMTHSWQGAGTAIGASDGVEKMKLAPGTKVRLRLINTDDWVVQKYVLTGTPFQVAAIDGTDLHEPGDLENTRIELPTGGRTDLTFEMPNKPVFLSVGNGTKLGILLSPDGGGEIPSIPSTTKFDPIHYGTPLATPFDANSPFDRQFKMVLDNKLGFFNGSFDQLYTINGEVFPNTPMFMVQEGDLVKVTITNRGVADHPIHLHGHHVLVLSYNGEPVTGSPWWSDTLGVNPGETYEVAFLADNPGIWMDHCHNLQHAAAGMTMHLSYEGVTTPFAIGSDTHNHPE